VSWLAGSIAIGAVCISLMPVKTTTKIITGVLYVPFMAFLLFWYTFMFIGSVYNTWL
jgi:hypothetical protein